MRALGLAVASDLVPPDTMLLLPAADTIEESVVLALANPRQAAVIRITE